MVEDLKIGEFYFKQESSGIIIQFTWDTFKKRMNQKTVEKLKDWLEEATKPRYYVKDMAPGITYIPDRPKLSFAIIDREDCNTPIAQYRTMEKAKKYCEWLNRGE